MAVPRVSAYSPPSTPMRRYFLKRRWRSSSSGSSSSALRWASTAFFTAPHMAVGSRWAAPGGSGRISSITPRRSRSSAVIFSASAASSVFVGSSQRIAVQAVAGQFQEAVADPPDVVDRGWPLRMPGDLRALPGGEAGVDLRLELVELRAELAEIVLHAGPTLARGGQLLDLLLDLRDGFLEV